MIYRAQLQDMDSILRVVRDVKVEMQKSGNKQ